VALHAPSLPLPLFAYGTQVLGIPWIYSKKFVNGVVQYYNGRSGKLIGKKLGNIRPGLSPFF
jgi:hypothetical protein